MSTEQTSISYDPISAIEKRLDIERVVDRLPEREKKAIKVRYLSGNLKSLDEAGCELGICGEAVRLREKRALKKLRHPSRRVLLDGYHR